MSHSHALYHWQQRLATFFAELSPPRRSWLALVSFGIVLAHSALLNTVTLKLAVALGKSFNTVRQRLRKLYRPLRTCDGHDNSFDYTACFAPLLRWATSGFTHKRLALAIDPTYLDDRFVVLTASVVFRGGAVPVAWHVQEADAKGSWNDHWQRLLERLREALDAQWEVLVLADRGLESATLFAAITQLGWHPLQRAKKAGHFRPQGWVRSWPMSRFAAQVGRHWKGRGVVWPGSSPLYCTLLACWDEGHEEAWLILTDLAPAQVCVVWYAFRSWIEHGFRDLKSDGWQLSKTRMTDPERVARWWAAVALATLWVVESGQQVQELELPATRTHNRPEKGAVTSIFALGLNWLGLQLSRGRIGRWHRLKQPKWRKDNRTRDKLSEIVWLEEHQKIPL